MELSLKGIHIQEQWANQIYSGHKNVEARTWDGGLYTDGRPLWLIETPNKPKGGKRSLAEITGVIRFGPPTEYSSYDEWRMDYLDHRVPRKNKFEWDPEKVTGKKGKKQRMFKWPILEARQLSSPIPAPPRETRGTVGSREHRATVSFEQ